MNPTIRPVKLIAAIIIFGVSTIYLFLLLRYFYPFLEAKVVLNRALYWFITGYCFFIPLFLAAVLLVWREGFHTFGEMADALRLKRMTGRDWLYSLISSVIIFALTGIILFASKILSDTTGIRELTTAPPELTFEPFKSAEKLLLLVWIPMWFFNIFGEELLWRGYIQTRLGFRGSWVIITILWAIMHIPFGFDMVIMALPTFVVLPYAVSRTGNTWVGIVIHGLYNGPIFVLISLGLFR